MVLTGRVGVSRARAVAETAARGWQGPLTALLLVGVARLDPRSLSQLATVLAVYLALRVVALGVASRTPPVTRPVLWGAALLGGLALAQTAGPFAPGQAASPWAVLVLVVGVPAAALSALRAKAESAPVGGFPMAPASLVATGAFGAVFGATGAAAGLVLGEYRSVLRTAAERPPLRPSSSVPRLEAMTVVDLLVAHHVLGPKAFTAFAAVWLLGRVALESTGPVLAYARRLTEAPASRQWPLIAGAAALVGLVALPGSVTRTLVGVPASDVLLVSWLGVLAVRAAFGRLALSLEQRGQARGTAHVLGGAVLLQAGLILGSGSSLRWTVTACLASALAGLAALSSAAVPAGVVRLRATDLVRRARNTIEVVLAQPATSLVAGLALIGLSIRLAAGRGLWLDEAISVAQTNGRFADMIAGLRGWDVHPPLYHSILWGTRQLIGTSEIAVRAPSIVAGTLLIPALYLAGRELYGRRTGLVAAAFGTVAPLLVWYSQEARMYALLMLVAVAAVWAHGRALRTGRLVDWVSMGALGAALLWTHYFAVIWVAIQHACVGVAIVRRRAEGREIGRLLRGWAAAALVLGALLVPLLPIVHDQLISSPHLEALSTPSRNPALTELSVYSVLSNTVWAMWGYHSGEVMTQLVALWPLGMLFVFSLLGRGRDRSTTLLLALGAIPVSILLLAGLKTRDLFEVRYFATTVPLAILLAAHIVTKVRTSWISTGVATAVVAASLVIALVDQQVGHGNPRRYDFERALARVEATADEGDVLLYAPRYLDSVVAYYAPGIRAGPLIEGRPPPRTGRVFVLTSYSLSDRREPPARVERVVSRLWRDRSVVDEFRVPQVRVRVFEPRT